MSNLQVRTANGRTQFEPGETIELLLEWTCDDTPTSAELRLVWYTHGKGDTDVGVVERWPLEYPRLTDQKRLTITLPRYPYSFAGRYVSLLWAFELLIDPGNQAWRLDIVIAPGAQEIVLASLGK